MSCRGAGGARRIALAMLLGALLLLPALQAGGEAGDAGRVPCFEGPLHVIPLRIHGGMSGRPGTDLELVGKEINRIWSTQAGICFAGEIVDHDEPLASGMDIWFVPAMKRYNGFFNSPHDIRVRDYPDLGPAADPAADGAARTAAHELGHSLGLKHRQDSDENLMRSKTFGWRLDAREIEAARRAAAAIKGGNRELPECSCPAEE